MSMDMGSGPSSALIRMTSYHRGIAEPCTAVGPSQAVGCPGHRVCWDLGLDGLRNTSYSPWTRCCKHGDLILRMHTAQRAN